MPTSERWTEETEALVMNAIASLAILRAGPEDWAVAAITALADAGLLVLALTHRRRKLVAASIRRSTRTRCLGDHR